MRYDGVDHVILPVADLDVAAEPFERLGLRVAPSRRFANGLANRVLFVGGPENLFWVDRFSAVARDEAARSAFGRHILDAMFELIGPASLDSPVASRPAGLSSMRSFEVPDLEGAVAQARAAGFDGTDPATGTLPGTRTARISADQLSGLTLRLLEYV